MALGALVFVPGCVFEAGPAHLRIQSGGVRYDDFVIEPIQEYSRLHSSEMVRLDALAVASEEELTLPKFSTGRTFTSLLVSAYHPEFFCTATGKADSSSVQLTLSQLHPQRCARQRTTAAIKFEQRANSRAMPIILNMAPT